MGSKGSRKAAVGGATQGLEPPSQWSKCEGMAGDKGGMSFEFEVGSIEAAKDEGGTCSCEGHLINGLVRGEAQDGTKGTEDGVVAAFEEVGAYVRGEDTHKVLEAADASDLQDAECGVWVAVGELGDDINEAVVAVSSVLEVVDDVVRVVGGVPRAAKAPLEAGPLLNGGGRQGARGCRGVGVK